MMKNIKFMTMKTLKLNMTVTKPMLHHQEHYMNNKLVNWREIQILVKWREVCRHQPQPVSKKSKPAPKKNEQLSVLDLLDPHFEFQNFVGLTFIRGYCQMFCSLLKQIFKFGDLIPPNLSWILSTVAKMLFLWSIQYI